MMSWHGRGLHLLDVAYPVPDVIERLLVGDVIHQHDALRQKQEVTSAREAMQVSFLRINLINRDVNVASDIN